MPIPDPPLDTQTGPYGSARHSCSTPALAVIPPPSCTRLRPRRPVASILARPSHACTHAHAHTRTHAHTHIRTHAHTHKRTRGVAWYTAPSEQGRAHPCVHSCTQIPVKSNAHALALDTSVAVWFRTRKSAVASARNRVKMCVRRPNAHTAALQRVRRNFSAPECTNMSAMSFAHVLMLTACVEACFRTRKRSRNHEKVGDAAQRMRSTITARVKKMLRLHLRGPFAM
jgi:hypothetical protein